MLRPGRAFMHFMHGMTSSFVLTPLQGQSGLMSDSLSLARDARAVIDDAQWAWTTMNDE